MDTSLIIAILDSINAYGESRDIKAFDNHIYIDGKFYERYGGEKFNLSITITPQGDEDNA